MTSFDLAGRLAVVIGGGEGIGAAIAAGLARAGADIVLAGRNEAKLAAAVELIGASGRPDSPTTSTPGEGRDRVGASPPPDSPTTSTAGRARARTARVDVTDLPSIAALAERYHADILVNSAGYSVTKPAIEMSEVDWDAVHGTQLKGTFFACQHFAAHMVANGYGKIVNLSSTWSVTAGPGRSVYGAAKAGVNQLTRALAVEWAPHGIRVNALAPTATRTPAVEQRFADDPAREEYLRAKIPLGRLATPDDMVGAAVFLASPASDFVTGQTLFVDGGWTAAT